MSDKSTNWLEVKKENKMLGWFIVACCSTNSEIFDSDFDSSEIDIQMTVNNHEVCLLDVFNDMEQQLTAIMKKSKREGFKKGVKFQSDKIKSYISSSEM